MGAYNCGVLIFMMLMNNVISGGVQLCVIPKLRVVCNWFLLINPQHACAARVTVVVLCVSVFSIPPSRALGVREV